MFSKTCEYAIRAMIFIAQQSMKGEKAGIKQVVKGIDCPEHFIAKILQELARKGLVLSVKGPNGGFYLEKTQLKFSLADVIRAVDGDKIFSGCGLGLAECSEIEPCPIHKDFKKIRNEMHDMLNNAKLGEFTEHLDNKLSFLK
ncbi:MAG: Rrf2 family transcriptional regulator [Bacteroidetes bacterium]|nr:Rrf2 family transcriptional regulator [Bacteroidota bacterium]